ncbi:hypothetical protein SERLA73DRAFT_186886 [Serpula lacrymans var. lacrymans S7.3]|uniref:Cyanovirin-N domain-containing protein n=2 Tax=Serpula lacrymans var. lacrymans TaxID=341189 RepID=F8Q818_SERL3|nr:uncharacterized protein SERLADRAFT_476158 [Serpula lacrymans var. lacrymans S7.9]EGN95706.1 hypothetical protein SERLA73DRAFT_186886 [Serpula lacrymans var. lacrymans S7.3]EGO21232.1 hypothetical protein SERLADRAFT_476158 [Serpula lacrymans var. lacrymans S7.9]
MQFTAVLTLACFLSLPVYVISTSGFAASCSNIQLSGSVLDATCVTDSGSTTATAIDLNNCVANYDGNLACAPSGSYSSSCDDCSLTDTTYLLCSCSGSSDGGDQPSGYNLDSCLGNNDGALTC